jgi:hypothetical protein
MNSTRTVAVESCEIRSSTEYVVKIEGELGTSPATLEAVGDVKSEKKTCQPSSPSVVPIRTPSSQADKSKLDSFPGIEPSKVKGRDTGV